MLLNIKKMANIMSFENLYDGFFNFENFKKFLDNTHKETNYSTAIDMKVAFKFIARRYWP
jgi:hypothetical protein